MKDRIELAKYFASLGFKKGAEIGVAGGDYSQKLCQNIPGLELHCVDPWEIYKENRRGGGRDQQYSNWDKAHRLLEGFNVTYHRCFSTEALKDFEDGSLDFVFIDGNHDFDYVMEDIIGWSRKVRSGGIVAGHDFYNFHNSGVIEAVCTYIQIHKLDLKLTEWNKLEYKDDRCPCFYWIKK